MGKAVYPRDGRCSSSEGEAPKLKRETGPERWVRWQRMLDEGVYATRAELARGEGVSRAAVTLGLGKL